ncbi:hypothetical protein DPMN_063084 [Dreissena polymorpha]|uniref:Uncharacterized protein n=1 Tax=Dreissena polymorpha TaxID=45954 RepID=A0A9D4CAP5_DREPO|nr:hypothetical protein DPMN_063084 [Dreissena polymorpha]
MSNYSKSDFFHWDDDDLDLDELLGDYTCSSDDSENVKPCKKVKVTQAIESVGVYRVPKNLQDNVSFSGSYDFQARIRKSEW